MEEGRSVWIHVSSEEDALLKVKEEMSKLDGKEVVNVCVQVVKGGSYRVLQSIERQVVLHRKPNTLISLSFRIRGTKQVPAVVCELVSLDGLYLGGNKLTTLPAQFAKLAQLKFLSMFGHQFEEFPLVVCELLNLEKLDMSYNQLSHLPPSILRLVNLNLLDLRCNRFQSIPMFVGLLPQLKMLIVGGKCASSTLSKCLDSLSLGNPLEGILQTSLVDAQDNGRDPSSSPKLLEYLRAASSLEYVILCGLAQGANNTWSRFLTRHLYDPRLFLPIWAFVEPQKSDRDLEGYDSE